MISVNVKQLPHLSNGTVPVITTWSLFGLIPVYSTVVYLG